MATHEHTEITGIYKRTTITVDGKDATPEKLGEMLREAAVSTNIVEDLEKYKQRAHSFVEQRGTLLPKATDEQMQHAIDTAVHIMMDVALIQGIIGNRTLLPNEKAAIGFGIHLGRMLERLPVLFVEPLAASGRKSNEGAVAGGKSKALSPEEKERREKEYRAVLLQIENENTYLDRTAILERVANHFEVSVRTVTRTLNGK